MKKASIFFVSILLLASCAPKEDVINIGVMAPLTGQITSLADFARNGMDIALEEINKEGINGKKLRLVYEDIDLCLPRKSVDAVRKFISVDKTPVIMSIICGGNQVVATYEITEQEKVVQFSTSAVISKISGIGEMVFRNIASNQEEMAFLASHIINTLGKKRVYIIHNETEWGHSYRDAIEEAFLAMDAGLSGESEVKLAEKDFRTYLAKVKASDADVLYINVAPASAGILIKQAREMGITLPITANYNIITPDTVEYAGNAANGVLFPYPKIPGSPEAKAFQTTFKKRFGLDSEIHAANSYDAVHIIADALRTCDLDTTCIKEYLYKMETYEGVGGSVKFDENGDTKKAFEMWTVREGERMPF